MSGIGNIDKLTIGHQRSLLVNAGLIETDG